MSAYCQNNLAALQFYLAGDRLCYEDAPSASAEIKYIPLDRIPMRALPQGYRPRLGVTLVDERYSIAARIILSDIFIAASCCLQYASSDSVP